MPGQAARQTNGYAGGLPSNIGQIGQRLSTGLTIFGYSFVSGMFAALGKTRAICGGDPHGGVPVPNAKPRFDSKRPQAIHAELRLPRK